MSDQRDTVQPCLGDRGVEPGEQRCCDEVQPLHQTLEAAPVRTSNSVNA